MELTLAGLEFGGTAEADAPLELPDIHVEVINALRTAGYKTAAEVRAAGAETLSALPGFDAETVAAVLMFYANFIDTVVEALQYVQYLKQCRLRCCFIAEQTRIYESVFRNTRTATLAAAAC